MNNLVRICMLPTNVRTTDPYIDQRQIQSWPKCHKVIGNEMQRLTTPHPATGNLAFGNLAFFIDAHFGSALNQFLGQYCLVRLPAPEPGNLGMSRKHRRIPTRWSQFFAMLHSHSLRGFRFRLWKIPRLCICFPFFCAFNPFCSER